MDAKRFLLVDDEELIRDSVGRSLKFLGHEVSTASNGKEALAMVLGEKGNGPFDLMITDVSMTEKTGVELILEMAENNVLIPTVVMTGLGKEEVRSQLDRLPNILFLEKPFETKDLFRLIDLLVANPPGKDF